MKKVLFVDDTPAVLETLRRTLAPLDQEWHMSFVGSGKDALATLQQEPFDVLVTDMVMPGMDGMKLLGEVTTQYPEMVRIAYSGDTSMGVRSAAVAHQYLAKPFEMGLLRSTVGRACALRELLGSESLRKLVSGIKHLPSVPSLYRELMNEMRSQDASLKKAAKIVSQDMAMVTKILQLVNSAFFGLRTTISNAEQAVALLGLDTIKSLVLSMQAFAQFDSSSIAFFSIDALWRHGLTTSNYARTIAKQQGAPQGTIDDAFTAGLLHDIGLLVLAANLPDQYTNAVALMQERSIPDWQAEKEVLGASHAEVGAYLLGIWGLSDSIVEAVAFHHEPTGSVGQAFSPLTAVHVANAFEEEDRAIGVGEQALPPDGGYLAQGGWTDQLPLWRSACQPGTRG